MKPKKSNPKKPLFKKKQGPVLKEKKGVLELAKKVASFTPLGLVAAKVTGKETTATRALSDIRKKGLSEATKRAVKDITSSVLETKGKRKGDRVVPKMGIDNVKTSRGEVQKLLPKGMALANAARTNSHPVAIAANPVITQERAEIEREAKPFSEALVDFKNQVLDNDPDYDEETLDYEIDNYPPYPNSPDLDNWEDDESLEDLADDVFEDELQSYFDDEFSDDVLEGGLPLLDRLVEKVGQVGRGLWQLGKEGVDAVLPGYQSDKALNTILGGTLGAAGAVALLRTFRNPLLFMMLGRKMGSAGPVTVLPTGAYTTTTDPDTPLKLHDIGDAFHQKVSALAMKIDNDSFAEGDISQMSEDEIANLLQGEACPVGVGVDDSGRLSFAPVNDIGEGFIPIGLALAGAKKLVTSPAAKALWTKAKGLIKDKMAKSKDAPALVDNPIIAPFAPKNQEDYLPKTRQYGPMAYPSMAFPQGPPSFAAPGYPMVYPNYAYPDLRTGNYYMPPPAGPSPVGFLPSNAMGDSIGEGGVVSAAVKLSKWLYGLTRAGKWGVKGSRYAKTARGYTYVYGGSTAAAAAADVAKPKAFKWWKYVFGIQGPPLDMAPGWIPKTLRATVITLAALSVVGGVLEVITSPKASERRSMKRLAHKYGLKKKEVDDELDDLKVYLANHMEKGTVESASFEQTLRRLKDLPPMVDGSPQTVFPEEAKNVIALLALLREFTMMHPNGLIATVLREADGQGALADLESETLGALTDTEEGQQAASTVDEGFSDVASPNWPGFPYHPDYSGPAYSQGQSGSQVATNAQSQEGAQGSNGADAAQAQVLTTVGQEVKNDNLSTPAIISLAVLSTLAATSAMRAIGNRKTAPGQMVVSVGEGDSYREIPIPAVDMIL